MPMEYLFLHFSFLTDYSTITVSISERILQIIFFIFIMYSRKVQVKYIADTRLQGRNQEKHMVIRH
jgi:hypothetical protein